MPSERRLTPWMRRRAVGLLRRPWRPRREAVWPVTRPVLSVRVRPRRVRLLGPEAPEQWSAFSPGGPQPCQQHETVQG
jgi:hypothetical protein